MPYGKGASVYPMWLPQYFLHIGGAHFFSEFSPVGDGVPPVARCCGFLGIARIAQQGLQFRDPKLCLLEFFFQLVNAIAVLRLRIQGDCER